jgi:hypothetical protein
MKPRRDTTGVLAGRAVSQQDPQGMSADNAPIVRLFCDSCLLKVDDSRFKEQEYELCDTLTRRSLDSGVVNIETPVLSRTELMVGVDRVPDGYASLPSGDPLARMHDKSPT